MQKQLMCGVVLILLATAALSCRYDNEEDLLKKNCLSSDSAVSFKMQVLPVFITNCALPNCHSGGSPQGNLNLDSAVAYEQISNKRKGYINTISPKKSVLYSSLVSVSNPMPPTGKLDECTIKLLESWMKQGAKNN